MSTLITAMLNPKTYQKICSPIRKENSRILDRYLHLIAKNFRADDVVLDVGCGIGDTTKEVLLPALPVKLIVAGDILPDMVEYAQQYYPHEKIEYQILDINCPQVEDQRFDHVFSFFCFQYLRDYRQPLKNVWRLLKPGGSLFLTLITENPFACSYEAMAKTQKWAPYMEDFKEHTLLYHNTKNPEEDFKKLLEEANFKVQVCNVEETSLSYANMDIFKEYLRVFNPFLGRIPDKFREDYFAEFVEHWRTSKMFPGMICCERKKILAKLNLMVVVAAKCAQTS